MSDINVLQGQWTDALGRQGQVASDYAARVSAGQTLGQQQIRQGVADAQRRMAAQAAATGNPGAQRAAAFGAGNMASAAIGQGAALSAQEQQAAAAQQIAAAQSQAQGYGQATGWQQQKDEADRNFIGSLFGGGASAAGGAAMMLSDETRKTAIRHLESGDADRALAALRGGPPQGTTRHEREAVRIMATPRGRAWSPGAEDARASDLERRLTALGADTSAQLRAATPRALGSPVAASIPYSDPLGDLPPVRIDTSRAYAQPPIDASAEAAPSMPDAAPLRVRARR